MVAAPRSRYRPDGVPDYSHRFHAGNVGDVWKHCALVEVLGRAAGAGGRVGYVESHAGAGRYALGPTGEWSEGIGRLWAAADLEPGDAVARYVALCRRLGGGGERPRHYPGSPAFARAVLGPGAPLALWERDAATAAELAEATRGDAHVVRTVADGLDALPDAVRAAAAGAGTVVALVDPPYTDKADWARVPEAFARAAGASTRACLLLWYPVKSLTRPNAMIARLQAAGVPGTIAELITTPLEHQRQRLNGSGVVLVRPPAGACAALAAAAPVLGARCATRPGAWSFRLVSWIGKG
jgi:23S rRNA (adenine2030-N6)-methyltransferase